MCEVLVLALLIVRLVALELELVAFQGVARVILVCYGHGNYVQFLEVALQVFCAAKV